MKVINKNMMKQAEDDPLNITESSNESSIQIEVIADVYQQLMQQNIHSTRTQPLSNAERQRRYREKRKAEKEKRKMNACTSLSQSRDVQPQQRQPQHDVEIIIRQPQSSAERQRKYRKLLREQKQQQQQIEDYNAITELQLQNVNPDELARKRYLNKVRQSRFRAKQRNEWHSTSSHQAQTESEASQLNNQKDFEEFDPKLTQNSIGNSRNDCDGLWFKKDLHTPSDNHTEFLPGIVTKENTRNITVSVPAVDPTMKYLVIDATIPNVELSPLNIKSEPDDDESDDDDDEPADIKRKVIGSEVSLPFRSGCVISVTSLASPSTNCNVSVSVPEVKQEPCSMDQYLEISPLNIKREPDDDDDERPDIEGAQIGSEVSLPSRNGCVMSLTSLASPSINSNVPVFVPEVKQEPYSMGQIMELPPLEIKIEPDDDYYDESPDNKRKVNIELSPLDIKREPDDDESGDVNEPPDNKRKVVFSCRGTGSGDHMALCEVYQGSDTDSQYESVAPGPSTKKKLRTEIGHKKCVTKYSKQDFKPSETQSTDNELRRLNKAPKTSADRGREFRARRAQLKQQNKQQQEPESAGPSEDNRGPSAIKTIDKRAKSAEATRRWRERKRAASGLSKKQAKTAAQRMREYRQRKKLAKKIQLKQQSDQDLDLVSTSSSQGNQRAGPSTTNSISTEPTRRGNTQSRQQIETDDDESDYDDDDEPPDIKRKVICSKVSLPSRNGCVMSVTSLASPSTNSNIPVSMSEVKQEPCSMDQNKELSSLNIKREPDDDDDAPFDIKRKAVCSEVSLPSRNGCVMSLTSLASPSTNSHDLVSIPEVKQELSSMDQVADDTVQKAFICK